MNALKIPVPNYERSEISVGIVHFGIDAFHRAHHGDIVDEPRFVLFEEQS